MLKFRQMIYFSTTFVSNHQGIHDLKGSCMNFSIQEVYDVIFKPRINDSLNNIHYIISLNNPNVACYANAIFQSIVKCSNVRTVFTAKLEMSIIGITVKNYVLNRKANTIALRQFAGDEYNSKVTQQDAPQFFQDLCNKSVSLRSCFEFQLIRRFKCSESHFITDGFPAMENILILGVPENYTSNLTLQKLLDFNCVDLLGPSKVESRNHSCTAISKNKFTMETNSKYLVVQLALFSNEIIEIRGIQYPRKLKDILLHNLHKEEVLINKKMYNVSSVFFHHGESAAHGHYTNIIFNNGSWYSVNDEIIQKNVK